MPPPAAPPPEPPPEPPPVPPSSAEPLIRLAGVGFAHPGGGAVLAGVDLELRAGERIAVVGGNGAGKTTLLHVIVGLRRATAGTVAAFGRVCTRERDFQPVRARAGLLFQDPDDQLFCPTVAEDVAFGPLNLGRSPAAAAAIAERTLADLGLAGFGQRITHKLSGGEKRLVSLAAVLAMAPDVLLLDEPTNALDATAAARLVDLLAALPQAMLIVTHDLALVERLATRVMLLDAGILKPASLHVHPHVHRHVHPHLHADGASGDHEAPLHQPAHAPAARIDPAGGRRAR
jgi:cobalt/nickel transport system ATP-binding protein